MRKLSMTRAEVLSHNSRHDCCVIIEDKVYRLEKWLDYHPGGAAPILSLAGKDATEAFRGFHPDYVFEKLKPFHYADVADCKVSPEVEEFRKINQELIESGIYNTNPYWYVGYGIWLLALYFTTFIGLYYATWPTVIFSGFMLGVFWQQHAFLGHDLCHNSVTHNAYKDQLIATISCMWAGISPQWWKSTHNVHHIVTNSVEQDPDIQHLPFICITEKFFRSVRSRFHNRTMYFNLLGKILVSYQHFLFYIVMACARVNLYIQSFYLHWKTLGKPTEFRYPKLDFICISVFLVSNIIITSFLPTWQMSVVYIVLAHLISGFLHVQITISHFGMPVNENADDPNANYSFIRTQFEHSLDVDCPWWLDWVHGGLQFQVVHHLFPRVPRHNLRYVRDNYIIPYANKYQIAYHHLSFLEANKFVVDRLRQTAMKARDVPNENLASWSTTIFNGRISTEFKD